MVCKSFKMPFFRVKFPSSCELGVRSNKQGKNKTTAIYRVCIRRFFADCNTWRVSYAFLPRQVSLFLMQFGGSFMLFMIVVYVVIIRQLYIVYVFAVFLPIVILGGFLLLYTAKLCIASISA